MDQRQLEKERIRLTRELSMLETQLNSAQRGKEEKIGENKQIRAEIEQLEEENRVLEEETRRLDEEIAGLDEEFKQAQLDAGRLRREIKINIERGDNEQKQADELRIQIARLEKHLDTLRREIKQEIDDRRNLESKLRKTNSHIDAMKENWWSSTFVTRKLEKQDWFLRTEELIPSSDGSDEAEEAALETAPFEEARVEQGAEEPVEEKPKDEDEGGIDFGMN